MSLRLPRLVLATGGTVMLAAGVSGTVLGVAGGAFVRSLLPRVVVDASAVGGATVALSAVLIGIGVLQLVLSRAAMLGGRWTTAAAVIVSALLAAVFVALAVVLATTAAAGGPPALVALAAPILLVALAYVAASIRLARSSVQ